MRKPKYPPGAAVALIGEAVVEILGPPHRGTMGLWVVANYRNVRRGWCSN